ncbi:hypothetical protein J4Q44_G00205820 [Coregonus suidteri]|uniref:TGF-beta family profile domain-containing protein n=1 Tax=Coregonus suidteri TaxID=861788 RepID=A0AAN8LGB5_9TELE
MDLILNEIGCYVLSTLRLPSPRSSPYCSLPFETPEQDPSAPSLSPVSLQPYKQTIKRLLYCCWYWTPTVPHFRRTYAFLCELQEFLSDVLPPQTQSQLRATPVPLYTLHSLPTLSLGVSSSETVPAGLLNSSALTLFSFPTLGSAPGAHRELALQPALLEVLRQRLEEVVVQMRMKEVGRAGMDRLRRLRGTVLPKEGEEPPAGPADCGGSLGDGEGGSRPRGPREGTPVLAAQPHCPWRNTCWLLLRSRGALERSPFCVPMDNEDLKVVELDQDGTKISIKPNMVTKECGCR